jgi:hypothetical protein
LEPSELDGSVEEKTIELVSFAAKVADIEV